jgi:toxin YoeB
MEIIFLPKAEEDLEFWQKSGNKTVLKKIAQLYNVNYYKSSLKPV